MAKPISPLVAKVAEHLASFAQECRQSVLPPLGVLSERLGVSRSTASKAVALLKIRGILEGGTGSRLRPVGVVLALKNSAAVAGSGENIAEVIRRRIHEGIYRFGSTLPKYEAFVLDMTVSRRTVSQAIRILAREGLIHRWGKTWVVGDAPSASDNARQRTILIVQPNSGTWVGLKTERTQEFQWAFLREADRMGIRLFPVAVGGPVNRWLCRAQGLDEILALARSMGDGYAGCLIVGLEQRYDNLDEVIRVLQDLGRPVVVFDREEGKRRRTAQSSLTTICYFDDGAMERAAINELSRHGHTCIIYTAAEHLTWRTRRGELLTEWGQKVIPGFRMITYSMLVDRFLSLSQGELATKLESLHRKGPRRVRCALTCLTRCHSLASPDTYRHLAHILQMFPAGWPWTAAENAALKHAFAKVPEFEGTLRYIPYALDPEITAVVFSRDREARAFGEALLKLGVDIPEDLSLVSFDNDLQHADQPITTIDLGAAHLGYAAFHTIVGDVPLVGRDRFGRFPASPIVLDRGSVGRAPVRGLKGNFRLQILDLNKRRKKCDEVSLCKSYIYNPKS